jgi:antirestriction protein ArdC
LICERFVLRVPSALEPDSKDNYRASRGRAYYRPSTDSIHLPSREAFIGTKTSTPAESYFSTLCHELCHWTSPESRCHRQLGQRFGDQAVGANNFTPGAMSRAMTDDYWFGIAKIRRKWQSQPKQGRHPVDGRDALWQHNYGAAA